LHAVTNGRPIPFLVAYGAEYERKKMLQLLAVAKAQGKHLGRTQLNLNSLTKQQREDLKLTIIAWKSKELSGVYN